MKVSAVTIEMKAEPDFIDRGEGLNGVHDLHVIARDGLVTVNYLEGQSTTRKGVSVPIADIAIIRTTL